MKKNGKLKAFYTRRTICIISFLYIFLIFGYFLIVIDEKY